MIPTLLRRCALLLLLLHGCYGSGSCRSQADNDLLAMLPANVSDLWWTPQLALTVQDITAFLQQLTKEELVAPYQQLRETMRQQLRFDPLSVEELARIGLDPHRGAVSFRMLAGSEPLLLLPSKDGRLCHQTLLSLLERLDGASVRKSEAVGRYTVESAGRPFGQEMVPSAHWALMGPYMVLARGSALDALRQFLTWHQLPKTAERLDQHPSFRQALQHIPTGSLMAFVRFPNLNLPPQPDAAPAQAPNEPVNPYQGAEPEPTSAAQHWLATSVQWRAEGLQAISYTPLTTEQHSNPPSTQQNLQLALASIDSNAMLYAVANGMGSDNFAQLANYPWLYQLLLKAIAPFEAQADLHFTQDVLPHIQGNWTVGIQLDLAASTQNLLNGLWQGFSPWAQLTRLQFTAQVEQAEQFVPVLLQLQQRCQAKQIPIQHMQLQQAGRVGHFFVPSTAPAAGKSKQAIPKSEAGQTPISKLLLHKSAWALLDNVFFYSSHTEDLPQLVRQQITELHDPLPGYAAKLLASSAKRPPLEPSALASRALAKANSMILVIRAEKLAHWLGSQLEAKPKTPLMQGLQHLQQLLLRLQDIVIEVEENPSGLRLTIEEVLR